jgi:hypothetical protein
MATAFASKEWVDALGSQLTGDAGVREQAATWVFGPVLLVVDADAEHGVDAAGILLDLHEGEVRRVSSVDPGSAARAPFVFGGTFARWKSVFGGALPMVDGVLQGQLRFRGDLPTITRHRALLDAVATVGAGVATQWQDEQAPAPA